MSESAVHFIHLQRIASESAVYLNPHRIVSKSEVHSAANYEWKCGSFYTSATNCEWKCGAFSVSSKASFPNVSLRLLSGWLLDIKYFSVFFLRPVWEETKQSTFESVKLIRAITLWSYIMPKVIKTGWYPWPKILRSWSKVPTVVTCQQRRLSLRLYRVQRERWRNAEASRQSCLPRKSMERRAGHENARCRQWWSST